MAVIRLVAVPCKLNSGIFPSERRFTVALANGDHYDGIAPRFFCWNAGGKIVEEDEPADGVDGLVAGKEVAQDDLPEDVAAVEVPDGEVLAIKRVTVRQRPTKISPPGVEVS
jgi:hypothetical protein